MTAQDGHPSHQLVLYKESHSSIMSSMDVTSDFLESELKSAESALQANDLKLRSWEQTSSETADVSTRLAQVDRAANEIALANDVVEVTKKIPPSDDVIEECERCHLLAVVLQKHEPTSSFYQQLFEEEYLPLRAFLRGELAAKVRDILKESKYTTTGGSEELLNQAGAASSSTSTYGHLEVYAAWTVRLKSDYQHILRHIGPTLSSRMREDEESVPEDIVLELCRPFVERVRFHFLEQSTDRLTSSRIDRVPEWLFGYFRDHIFESGPWDVIDCLATSLQNQTGFDLKAAVVNELVGLAQFVLGERNFLRHPKISGPDSNPLLLCNAIEQLIQFDSYIRGLIDGDHRRILSLTDILVAGDDELLQWWLQREKESAFTTLFEAEVERALVSRISPRAELFCSLIHSILCKAAVFSFSGPYLNHVAAPLCMQFVEAVHETATSLRRTLTRRQPLSELDLKANIKEWIEIINGTHMASQIMMTTLLLGGNKDGGDSQVSNGDQDIIRFGRSLQSLEGVLLEEFTNSFVETLLVERAKLAGYLMRCSHLLATSKHGGEDFTGMGSANELLPTNLESHLISADLRETSRYVEALLSICDEALKAPIDLSDNDGGNDALEIARYAPGLLRDQVLSKLALKFIEVAMDLQGMTPDLMPFGCSVFFRDMETIFDSAIVPEAVLRLLDIANLMSMDQVSLARIGDALCGLVNLPAPLDAETFAADERVYDEAMSMIRAKQMLWIELEDVLSILNRRRDLTGGGFSR